MGSDVIFGDNTFDYAFTDGTSEGIEFVQTGVGNFPWNNGEPDHSPFTNENCVEYLTALLFNLVENVLQMGSE